MREALTLDPRAASAAVDRVATVGIAITLALAAAFVALDPIQHVDRRSTSVAPAPIAAPEVTAPASSPIVPIVLPDQPPSIATDGRVAAYPRLAGDGGMEIVVRDLGGPGWHVAYRTTSETMVGPLAMSSDLVVFEESELAGGALSEIRLRSLRPSTGEVALLDRFVPTATAGGYAGALPRSDGARLVWVRRTQSSDGPRSEVRVLDLASGTTATVLERNELVTAIALWKDTLAFTLQPAGGPASSYALDLSGGAVAPLGSLHASYVQTAGPQGVFLLGASRAGEAPLENWLVTADGAAIRIGSGCTDVAHNERFLALRCGTRVEIRDLALGTTLDRFAAGVGALAIFDGGVLWSEGAELQLFRAPAADRDLLP